MNIYIISQKYENKHLQFFHYKFIINSLNQFNAQYKNHKGNTGKLNSLDIWLILLVLLSLMSIRYATILLEILILMGIL